MDAATWQSRRAFLGASEVPAVCGLDPMKTAADIWATKRGIIGQEEDSEQAEAGHLFEKPLLDWYARKRTVPVVSPTTIVRGHRGATPDGIATYSDHLRDLQVKVVGAWMLPHWRDGSGWQLPDYVEAQVQAELDLTGLQVADVIACLGGTTLEIFEVRRDDEAIAAINRVCDRFWQRCVIGGEIPDISKSRIARRIAGTLYPKGSGMGRAVPEFAKMAERYAQLGKTIRDATDEKEALCIGMKLAIGDKEGLEWSGGKATWRGKKTRTFRVKIDGEQTDE